jgi:hypothetical protein
MKDACNAWHIHITFVMPTAGDMRNNEAHATQSCS